MSDSEPPLTTFEWTPPSAGARPDAFGELAAPPTGPDEVLLSERLAPVAENRGLGAADVVRKAARAACEWLTEEQRPDEGAAAALGVELTELRMAHGWRGPVARFLAALDAVGAATEGAAGPAQREALAAEASRWLETADSQLAEPLLAESLLAESLLAESLLAGERPRLADRGRCAAGLLGDGGGLDPRQLEEGESVLVHGWSETVAQGLELAQARGLRPRVIVSEGGPDLGGRRLARRLVACGMEVRFVYDAALVDALRRADRVWVGTEAVGARSFLARIGTRALLEHARDLDVPTAVLTTTDKRTPNGEVGPPAWAADEPWHLWEGAPSGVSVESQSFEAIPLELTSIFATEVGLLGAREMAGLEPSPAGA